MADPDYEPVAARKFDAMLHALRDAPATDGRFSGTLTQQEDLAEQMRDMFDDDPSPGPDAAPPVYLKRSDTLALASELEDSHANWSLGQYSQALATLMRPE